MKADPLEPFSTDRGTGINLEASGISGDAAVISKYGQPGRCSKMSSSFVSQYEFPPDAVIPTPVAANAGLATKAPRRSHGAFELKFLIDEHRALDIMVWARIHLDPDPHFDPELGDGYRVNSLYLDNSQFDVFHRAEAFQKRKYRLRRYGRESLVWLEEKCKQKSFVRKRRVPVGDSEVSTRLGQPAEVDWDGNWFRRKVDKWNLRPVCQITYQRFARLKTTADGPIRMTIDDQLVASRAEGWMVPVDSLAGASLLNEKRILELKFRGGMPALFRELIEEQQLQVTSFSKYRTSIEKCPSLKALLGDNAGGLRDA